MKKSPLMLMPLNQNGFFNSRTPAYASIINLIKNDKLSLIDATKKTLSNKQHQGICLANHECMELWLRAQHKLSKEDQKKYLELLPQNFSKDIKWEKEMAEKNNSFENHFEIACK